MIHCRVPPEPSVRARARNERSLFHSIGRCVRVEERQRPHTTYTKHVVRRHRVDHSGIIRSPRPAPGERGDVKPRVTSPAPRADTERFRKNTHERRADENPTTMRTYTMPVTGQKIKSRGGDSVIRRHTSDTTLSQPNIRKRKTVCELAVYRVGLKFKRSKGKPSNPLNTHNWRVRQLLRNYRPHATPSTEFLLGLNTIYRAVAPSGYSERQLITRVNAFIILQLQDLVRRRRRDSVRRQGAGLCPSAHTAVKRRNVLGWILDIGARNATDIVVGATDRRITIQYHCFAKRRVRTNDIAPSADVPRNRSAIDNQCYTYKDEASLPSSIRVFRLAPHCPSGEACTSPMFLFQIEGPGPPSSSTTSFETRKQSFNLTEVKYSFLNPPLVKFKAGDRTLSTVEPPLLH
ncbi:hypothetical protein EVAR_50202_1 [Eumeta japonica]|uniref:Uncharacterized protein n=1 Tax=Eumeta variegata TaxID=151549 RepID=A0A4C1WW84_EUMVA|nr:hypothetical protein EVAR_50202_1 [Eumeta japonica]